MILPSLLAGLTEVRAALACDPTGRLLEAPAGETVGAEQAATRAAAVVTGLDDSGRALGLGGLAFLSVKWAGGTAVVAVRPDAIVQVEVATSQRPAPVEKTLGAWAQPSPSAVATAAAQGPADASPSQPQRLPRVARPAAPAPGPAQANPPAASAQIPISDRLTPMPANHRPAEDTWAGLRRALARGHLTEAAARQRTIAAGGIPGGWAGAEPMAASDLADAMQRMVEGIGSVLAGDTLGASRLLRDLAAPAQPNLSLRWAALHWSARAALGSGGLVAARQHVKDALAVSRQLEVADRAMSQLIAAELLARGGDPAKALNWLGESRSRFERVGDGWGIGQAWLAEAHILAEDPAASGERCAEAARRAWEADPEWDGPPIFLAGRALMRGDLASAESILGGVQTPAADRVRRLVEAVRQGVLTQPDASEFLRVRAAPPTAPAIRVLERIAQTAPRFYQAREALAWMLLKQGRYGDAQDIFNALGVQPLAPADRAVVTLGLSCIDSAMKAGGVATRAPAAPPAAGSDGQHLPRVGDSSLLPRGPQLGGPDAVFAGRLAVFQLPDLMEFLRTARRSGLLVLSSEAGLASMRFRGGFISAASSPATPGLSAILAGGGNLPDGAAPAVGETDASLAERLVRQGLVGAPSVEGAVRQQIELTLRELLRWKDGEFAFSHEVASPPGPEGSPVEVDAQALLLTLYKEMDEASRGPAAGASPAQPPARP